MKRPHWRIPHFQQCYYIPTEVEVADVSVLLGFNKVVQKKEIMTKAVHQGLVGLGKGMLLNFFNVLSHLY